MHRYIPKLVLGMVSFTFTALVFVNTYEVVFNRDVAVAQSVRRLAAQTAINTIAQEFAVKPGAEEATNSRLEHLEYFEVPALSMRVPMEEGRRINGQWYERPSLAQYIGLNRDAQGTTVDYLIYTTKSWRVIPEPNQLEVGMEVRLFSSKGAMSVFEVAEKRVLPLDRSLLVDKSENRQLLLMIEDPQRQLYYGYSLVLKK